MPKIGLALGGGGAKGLAHVLMLEALEEMGVTPHCIAGTSIGAVFGAACASGLGAERIRQEVDDLLAVEGIKLRELLFKRDARKVLEFFEPAFRTKGGVLRGDNFVSYLIENIEADTFEDLAIPLKVVATDFWERKEIVFSSGDLRSAIRSSLAIPWLLTPVRQGGTVLVDGSAVNPLPYDLIQKDCDLTIAIDVMGTRNQAAKNKPSMLDYIFNTYQIMQKTILAEKMKRNPPDIYIEVDVANVKVMEFFKAGEVYRQARQYKDELKNKLEAKLG